MDVVCLDSSIFHQAQRAVCGTWVKILSVEDGYEGDTQLGAGSGMIIVCDGDPFPPRLALLQ